MEVVFMCCALLYYVKQVCALRGHDLKRPNPHLLKNQSVIKEKHNGIQMLSVQLVTNLFEVQMESFPRSIEDTASAVMSGNGWGVAHVTEIIALLNR